jgi:hypothetical protein
MMAALIRGMRFLPPRRSNVYMPIRNALSCKKKISAIVADGRHSTGLTAIPWKIRAIRREVKFGDNAHHIEDKMKMMALNR